MNYVISALLVASLSACGVETATTAATVAEAKRREMEAAKNTMERAKQKIEQNTQLMQKSAEQSDPDKPKE